MAKRIYVGNLPWSTTSSELEAMFREYGDVVTADIVMDRSSGRSRGFAFVEMATDAGGDAAIQALNGKQVNDRPLTVNEARERAPRSGGEGGGGLGYGGGRGGYDR